MSRPLPGFYYDEERNRYFPITTSGPGPHPQDKGKYKKLKTENNKDLKKLEDEYISAGEKIISHQSDPFTRLYSSTSITIPRALASPSSKFRQKYHNERAFDNIKIQKFRFNELHTTEKLIQNKSVYIDNEIYFTTTFGRIVKCSKSDKHNISLVSVFDSYPGQRKFFECTRIEYCDRKIFVHFQKFGSNYHEFLLLANLNGIELEIINRRTLVSPNGSHIFDSTLINNNIIVTSKNKLNMYAWDSENAKRTISIDTSKNPSDILSIAKSSNSKGCTKIYCSTRSGLIVSVDLMNKDTIRNKTDKLIIYNIPDIKSVISIKSGDNNGILYASVIEKTPGSKMNTEIRNKIVVIDLINIKSHTKGICEPATYVKLETNFSNFARGTGNI
ncbi:hypothetical protein Kpol_541p43 [Vanderwaltozyma polyspora DSM 70294]|uniref:Uncharacterized protein n=1 Tax=Vanderwaltozyma polyspora (strain ATCC 22028 / DSM 70294 / BCRC 21397 / CBS 2163 / NBRC 10782 / NRRL Y-8283 / UCD 57-17) TaxID=436907 RepID=A7TIY9_VANPO|nr:uncharacterized protein Kpol_541p43 [Vanderwaltozyma polyspora DSM 70294]EDO17801.1 hypothetical protein Kpol_541p43 [Vanderwaltozyma polyspora DSM 70294]